MSSICFNRFVCNCVIFCHLSFLNILDSDAKMDFLEGISGKKPTFTSTTRETSQLVRVHEKVILERDNNTMFLSNAPDMI